MTDCYDFMNADPTFKKLGDDISASWEKHRELESDRRSELRHINILSHAIDLTRKQQFKFEDTSKKLDNQLEDLTGDCGECWYYTFDKAGDLIEQYQGQLAQNVAEITVNLAKLKLERDALSDTRQELGKKLRNQFHKEQDIANKLLEEVDAMHKKALADQGVTA